MVAIRRIRPTRRGLGVLVVLALAVTVGWGVAPDSLAAVVVPGSIALVVGVAQLAYADAPELERSEPAPGFPGERRSVAVSVTSTVPCTVVEPIGDGVSLPGGTSRALTETPGHGGEFEYTVDLDSRGTHRLGPARCRLTDSFGLFSVSIDTDGAATAVVYPTVYDIDPSDLSWLSGRLSAADRSSFRRLREYESTDSVRDIHWRASARRPDDDFLVAEYGGRSVSEHVTIVGETDDRSPPRLVDAMASTVASLAVHLAESGRTLTVAVGADEVPASVGSVTATLEHLARADGGECSAVSPETADVHVSGDSQGIVVTAAGRSVDIDLRSGTSRLRVLDRPSEEVTPP